MNLRKLSIIACVVICGALVAHAVQDGMEDMQKKWMDYMTPGKQHQEMAASAGKWDVKSSFWMMPGGEPMVSSAKSTIETSMRPNPGTSNSSRVFPVGNSRPVAAPAGSRNSKRTGDPVPETPRSS